VGTLKLRDMEVTPGTKSFGGVTCGEWPDGSPVRVPVAVVNGKEPGPTVMVMAGVHGDEVVGTETVRKVAAELDPTKMRGTFIGLPAVNIVSYILNSRVNTLEDPFGWNDFWYLIPNAQRTGSLTERLACFVRDEVVPLCDYFIDLHSSAKGSTNYPRAIVAGDYVSLKPDVRKKVERLAQVCGFEYVFKPKGSTWAGMYFAPFNFIEETYGKAGIVLETGHAPTTEGVDILVIGVRNILVDVGIINGKVEDAVKPTYLERLVAVRANRGGIWHPKVWIPYVAKEGDVLGHVTGLTDTVVEEVRAPASGIAIKAATSAAVATGTRLFVLGIPYQ